MRLELRAKDLWVTMFAFILMVVVVFGVALGGRRSGLQSAFPGILWVAFLFAGTLGIGRGFAREVPEDALTGLLLAPGDRAAVFGAKLAVAFLFMVTVELVSSPIFFIILQEHEPGRWIPFGVVLVLGAAGFAGVGTLLAAMAVNVRGGEMILPVLMLPLELPVIVTAVSATRAALMVAGPSPWPWIKGLGAYDVIFLALPMMLYEYVWEV